MLTGLAFLENNMVMFQKKEERSSLMTQHFHFLASTPENAKTLIQKRYMHTPLYIAALSTMAKIWEQLQSLRTDEWIKKL